MIEVLFQNNGWFTLTLTEGFQRELDVYQTDVELLRNGKWQRAALVRIYLTRAGAHQPNEEDNCCVCMEGSTVFITWRELRANSRPFTPEVHFDNAFYNAKEAWDQAIDAEPLDWDLRGAYADWLEEAGCCDWLMEGQRYQIANKKTLGPACVQEAAWHEATWFTEKHAGHQWYMRENHVAIIKPAWCLPCDLFQELSGYLLCRRGHHNRFAKSWNSRRQAEIGLALALQKSR